MKKNETILKTVLLFLIFIIVYSCRTDNTLNSNEEILQRKKKYVEIENHKILLPENTTLKKFQNALSGSGYEKSCLYDVQNVS